MPDFDGNGPLKRGRVIGRGLGPCKHCTDSCTRKAEVLKAPVKKETAEG